MDFPKFISLLESSSLYLTRADSFEDPLEGSVPDWFLENMFFGTKLFTPEHFDYRRQKYLEEIKSLKEKTFVSCWNCSKEESYALWNIYAKANGVAIKTTKNKIASIINGTGARIYKVKYADSFPSNLILPYYDNNQKVQPKKYLRNHFVIKHKHYEYENEARVIMISDSNSYQSLKIGNLNDFIEEILISPFSEDWFFYLVEKVVKERYGLSTNVIKSNIQL
jgi:hypothetical protein